ncbi:hypothetical protein KCP70_06055 [Salmonella enterica subsp. enterica]|nr:hypothetical protein KCP70_06055 [Salmonella enterica subsp. enterica]
MTGGDRNVKEGDLLTRGGRRDNSITKDAVAAVCKVRMTSSCCHGLCRFGGILVCRDMTLGYAAGFGWKWVIIKKCYVLHFCSVFFLMG